MKNFYIIFILILFHRFGFSQIWSDVGGGVNDNSGNGAGTVEVLKEINGELFFSGSFDTIGELYSFNQGRWNGNTMEEMCTMSSAVPKSYCGYKDKIYAGGTFFNLCGINSKSIARWNNGIWEKTDSSTQATGGINEMVVYKNELYVAGNITNIRGLNVNRIAKFDGQTWSDVGGGVTGGFQAIYCMATLNNELYIGGDFSKAGGDTAYCIAKWDGQNWSEVGGGFNGMVQRMVADTVNNKLYVHGLFSEANYHDSKPISWIAEWDGVSWKSVGNPNNFSQPNTLEIYKGKLFAGLVGFPDTFMNTILIKWNGLDWEEIAFSHLGSILDLEVFNDELYIGGGFDTINGIPFKGIARYQDTSTSITNLISEPNESGIFKVYPNPFKKKIFIEYESIYEATEFSLFNSSGTLIYREYLRGKKGRKEIEVKDFSEGLYLYRIASEQGISSGKLFLMPIY